MFVCLLIYSLVFCFNHRRIPKGSFPQNLVKIGLDLAEILRIRKIRLAWWRREGKGRGGILLCNFNYLGTPKGTYPENFVKIGLDLAEILRISKLDWRDREGEKGWKEEGKKKGRRRRGILLCNGLIILEHPQEYTLKISWRLDLIWPIYIIF